jgi:hypothetical protein
MATTDRGGQAAACLSSVRTYCSNDPAIREVIQGSYRIVYRLIYGGIHILTVHYSARLLKL